MQISHLRFRCRPALAACVLIIGWTHSQAAPAQAMRGTPHQVVLTRYAATFSNAQIMRRLLSPLAQEAVHAMLIRTGKTLSPYPIDLSKAKFILYVPAGAPPSPHGYPLLVFIPPWNQAYLPFGWAGQLDRHGFIFVAPDGAGNAAAVLSRRVPLALAAEANIVREYPVDPERIYIGGFSGGSRVAQHIALGYSDVFHGALLDAGADPLGGTDPLPPRDLFLRFQSSSHLVYVTGDGDAVNLQTDASSSESMRQWCVFDVETHETPGAGHELMSAAAFGEALGRLSSPGSADPGRLEGCRSRVSAELEEQLGRAQSLIAEERRAAAHKLLLEIDSRFGGLAAPRILALARGCGCGLARP